MTIRRVLALLTIAAAGCGGVLPVDATGGYGEDSGTRKGIDYAWGRPGTGAIRAGGYSFAARYLSYDNTGKNLSPGEADALRGAGIDVVVVWEAGGSDVLNGYNEGVHEAESARAQAQACGQPADRPIYFAIDFDAQAYQQGAIDSYFDGVASVIGRGRTGAYGGINPIARLFSAGKIAYGWQTYAWSGGQWDSRAQLRQVQNDIFVGGVDVDLDHAVADDFGQWGYRAAQPPTDDGQRLAVGRNHDGRLELFYARAGDGALAHDWQDAAGWSGLDSLGGEAKSLVVAANADGRLEVFYVGTDDRIYHNFQVAPGAGWYGQVPLGGAARQLAVARNADGRLELFYVGTNSALYHNYQKTPNGDWSGESALGGTAKQITVGENADGRLELVYVGTNDALYHNYQIAANAGWSGESGFGGEAKRVAIARNADGRLEVFYVGTNDALYHNYQTAPNAGWSGQSALGGEAKDLAVARNTDGRLELFYIGTNDALYHNYQIAANAGWSGESPLGGEAKELAIARNADGRLELFYIGTNDSLYHNWQKSPGAGWSGEHPL